MVFNKFLRLAFILFIIYSFFSSNDSNLNFSNAKFSELTTSREAIYTWNYNGDDYSISETLYSSVYEDYREKPIVYLINKKKELGISK